MFTIFLKYDRQLVPCADGGQIGLDWLVHARFARPAPVPAAPPGRRGRWHQTEQAAAEEMTKMETGTATAIATATPSRNGATGASSGMRSDTATRPTGLGASHAPLLPAPPRVAARNIPNAADLPLDAPVFIMLHGINGGSHEGPTKWAVATGAVRGWRCVALNLRGCNGGVGRLDAEAWGTGTHNSARVTTVTDTATRRTFGSWEFTQSNPLKPSLRVT
jgi:predicted alpha/beta-fold hydrolase